MSRISTSLLIALSLIVCAAIWPLDARASDNSNAPEIQNETMRDEVIRGEVVEPISDRIPDIQDTLDETAEKVEAGIKQTTEKVTESETAQNAKAAAGDLSEELDEISDNSITDEGEEAIKKKAKTTKTKATDLMEDLKKARDTLVGKQKESTPFLRGMILPFFQPVFLIAMIVFGLWTGQLREALPAVWVIPMTVVAAMVAAAFITVFIPELRPNLSVGEGENLLNRTSIDTIAVIPAILLGLIVGLRLRMVPVIAFLFSAAIGLFFGFTRITDITPHTVDFILFWLGFGLTSLIFSVFGIGLQDFLRSMGMGLFVRAFGFISVLGGIVLAVAVF